MSDYIDLSGPARRMLADRIAHFVEAVANDLRNEIVTGMDPGPGPRTGHEYPMPGGKSTYVASAPGEPPAVRTGEYVGAWQATPAVVEGSRVLAAATNDRKTEDGEHFIGEILEYGTNDGQIQPRPHIRPAMETVAQRWGGRVRSP